MSHFECWIAGLGLAACVCMAAPAGAAPEKLLYSFEDAAALTQTATRDTRVALTTEGVTEGKQALRVEFAKVDWPNVSWKAGDAAWDWSDYGYLAFDVYNPGNEDVPLAVRVDDDPSSDGVKHCRTGGNTIAAGQKASFALNLGGRVDAMAFGMRGLPGPQGTRSLGGGGSVDPAHVVAFQIFLPKPTAARTLIVDNIRLLPATSLDGIVDAYGQYARADWPGKLHNEAEFAQRIKAEEADLRAHPAPADRDQFGGWANGPTLRATGFFRAERWQNKWWLVAPNGHLFFSMGIDCVRPGSATITTGRERMFTWLPKEGEPLARYYGTVNWVHSGPVKSGKSYNFASANLERKYGQDYFPGWSEMTVRRLPSWGFNTIANWSDPRVYGMKKLPYTATMGVGGNHQRIAAGSDYWGKMHDPFDPQFAVDADNDFRQKATELKNDPLCLGYFIDNELSWGGWGEDGGRYGLAHGALVAPAGQAAKAAFVAQLREKYQTIDRLNAAWDAQLPSWDELAGKPFEPKTPLTAAAKADMSAFVKAFSLKYFTVVRDTLKKYDPNHLYLGCRFAWRCPEAVEAAAEVCDVVSFNIYQARLQPKDWNFTSDLGKPCIIGEFHFGALDRGMFHTGLVSVPDQATRARTYQEYLRSVADLPAFVGCHWFQYQDEPLTGRTLDGENYNIGFVTVTDTPYPELVAAARAVHAEIYRYRAGK